MFSRRELMGPKTFKAPTAKQVLSKVSHELGPDAIIASHRKMTRFRRQNSGRGHCIP